MKTQKLNEKLTELSKMTILVNKEKSKLQDLYQKKEQMKNQVTELDPEQNNIIDVNYISLVSDYLPLLNNQIKNQDKIIKDMNEVLDLKQEEINLLYKEKKVLEKLKEKQQTDYYNSVDELINKELDDITISRYKLA